MTEKGVSTSREGLKNFPERSSGRMFRNILGRIKYSALARLERGRKIDRKQILETRCGT